MNNIKIQKLLYISNDKEKKENFIVNLKKDFPKTFTVSFCKAVELIEEERKNDDSDYIEGGIDIGRTAINYLCQKTLLSPEIIKNHEIISITNSQSFLNRGLKYLSTGEMRKLLLCQGILENPDIIIIDNIFEGLDIKTRQQLSVFFESFSLCNLAFLTSKNENYPFITKTITENTEERNDNELKQGLFEELILNKAIKEEEEEEEVSLVSMKNVTVSWGDKIVLKDLNWNIERNQHWLITGPNGSGKTTLLELITGDNLQVFRNEIYIFGKKRGSGETIWDIKAKLGIVSQKIHTEYRLINDIKVIDTIISGWKDSIGIYEQITTQERTMGENWLKLFNKENLSKKNFKELSYGEQRAILIIRALVKLPEILILDEPCHNLTNKEKKLVMKLIEEIAKLNTTTILHVTHDKEEIMSFEKNILELCPDKNPMYYLHSIC